jgi:hypothetical protein
MDQQTGWAMSRTLTGPRRVYAKTTRIVSLWTARRTIVVTVLIGCLSAFAAWSRVPAIARDTLWAEDGRNFLQDALSFGPFDSLFLPYAGYLHTLPRIVAALTVQFVPVQFFALSMTAGACLAAGVMASIVYVCSRDVLSWVPARMLIASLTVLAPLVPREVLGNMANLHSLVLWTMLWVLLYRPRTRAGGYALTVFALLGTLTEIECVFLLPLLLWQPKDRRRWTVRGAYLLGVTIQLCVSVIVPRGQNGNPPVGFPSILYGYLINSVVPLWVPQNSIGAAVAWGGPLLCTTLLVPFLIALFIALKWGSSVQRVAAIALVAGPAVIYSVSVIENPSSIYDYAHMSAAALRTLWLARYGVIPSMMLCALLLLAAGIIITRPKGVSGSETKRRTTRNMFAELAVAGLVVLLLVQFVPQNTRRSSGPQWQPQIAALRSECQRAADSHSVPIDETIHWHVDVHCGRIE